MSMGVSKRKGLKAFTLVELAVVILLIGVLAAFGIPRAIRSVERAKADKAFAFLEVVQAEQERYQSKEGVYSSDLASLNLEHACPPHFRVPAVISPGNSRGGLLDSWSLTLTREGESAGFGSYSVTFNQNGYDQTNSTIETLSEIKPARKTRARSAPGIVAHGKK
ncbi:MAG: hypothetical protein NVSMB9_33810 [Isosphaeraceae bacterium]